MESVIDRNVRLLQDSLYSGDDPADDLVGRDVSPVWTGAGLGQSLPTRPAATQVSQAECGPVLTGAVVRSLVPPAGRDTELVSRILGNLLGLEGTPVRTEALVWD